MTERQPSTPPVPSTSATSSAGCIGVYGVILTVMGIFGDEERDKTGDVNANLWAGLVMLVDRCGVPALGAGAAGRRASRDPAGSGQRRVEHHGVDDVVGAGTGRPGAGSWSGRLARRW